MRRGIRVHDQPPDLDVQNRDRAIFQAWNASPETDRQGHAPGAGKQGDVPGQAAALERGPR
jgi:hypothetical protein